MPVFNHDIPFMAALDEMRHNSADRLPLSDSRRGKRTGEMDVIGSHNLL